MSSKRKLVSAKHHWWPRSLSKQWAAADGCVTQLSWDGSAVRSPPANFGVIGNAHYIKFSEDSPWNYSFESVFGSADSQFPYLAAWLLELETKSVRSKAQLKDRFLVQPLTRERRNQLAEGLSSLIVRSPRSRNNIRITIQSYASEDGIEKYPVDKKLIAANMQASHGVFTRVIDGGGKFVILISEGPELICGDGFLHNFPIGRDRPLSARCVVPVLPSVAVLFVQPTFYRTHPELITMRLRTDEINFLNYLVQVYSCDRLFYRNEKPKMVDAFARREHMELTYHQHPWLEQLIQSAVEFVPSSPV